MKKGDIRRQEILNTAESLFCRKGYEQTSIQDILDQLKSSKGSFYHYFISKEALLQSMCDRRAGQLIHSVQESLSAVSSSAGRLNILFSGMIPLRDEKLSFLLMFLPIFRLPEGQTVKTYYCEALSARFYESVRKQLEEGNEAGELSCSSPAVIAEICLTLVNQLWVRICEMILSAEEAGEEADLSEILRIIEEYRIVLEKITGVPFGSFELMNIEWLKSLNEQIHNHWPARNEQGSMVIQKI